MSAIDKAVQVLHVCGKYPSGVGFKDLSKELGWQSMTLTRVLKPMVSNGLLKKDSTKKKYFLGAEIIRLGKIAAGEIDRGELFAPIVERLALDCEESAAYFDWDGDWVRILAKKEVPGSFHYIHLLSRKHDVNNSFFKTIAAFLSEDDLHDIQNKSKRKWENKSEKDKIKRIRFHIGRDPYKGACLRYIAPVFNGPNGEIAGSIGISSLILEPDGDTKAKFTELVAKAGEEATKLLG